MNGLCKPSPLSDKRSTNTQNTININDVVFKSSGKINYKWDL